jgi:hypothetical protein
MSMSSQNAQPQYVVTELGIPIHYARWGNLPVYKNPDVSTSPTETALKQAPQHLPKPLKVPSSLKEHTREGR